ncbi:MAG: protein BatD [Candidatus Omnitrophica bacterium]|nr:protein BatD [Candidatus Omnitrophota bacterium]
MNKVLLNIFSRWTRFLWIPLVVMMHTPLCHAQEVRLEAEISSTKITLDGSLQLTLTVYNHKNAEPIVLPAIEGFDANYRGQSSRVSIVNGQYSNSVSFTYVLYPQKTGQFTIPAIVTEIEGQKYSTQSISVEVIDGSAGSSNNLQSSAATTLKDQIFLVIDPAREQLYINQGIPVKLLFYVTGLEVRDIQYPAIEAIGFSMDDYSEPKQYQKVINGRRFDIIEFETVLYPTRIGEVKLGPATLDCNIVVRGNRGNAGGFSGLFNDDFFESFFDRYEKRPIKVKSNEVTLMVKDLPKEGQPSGFSGAVGEYTFNMTVSPTKVKVGDPITVRMTVEGKGNLKAVNFPKIPNQDDFKLYDPIIKEEENKKILEQVIIPKTDQVKEVGRIEFSFFHDKLEQYRSIAQGPFSIEVEAVKGGDSFNGGALANTNIDKQKSQEDFGEDIVFIKRDLGEFKHKGRRNYNSWLFYVMIIVSLGGWTAAYIYYQKTHKMETDVRYARQMLAPKKAKKGLAEAQKSLQAGRQEDFYNSLFKTLQQYLSHKLHIPVGAVTYETVIKKEKVKGLDVTLQAELKTALEECDMIRYASISVDASGMKQSYDRVEKLIDHFERTLK